MKKRNKLVALALALTLVASTVTGCGSTPSSDTGADTESGADAAVVETAVPAETGGEDVGGIKEVVIGIPATPESLSPFVSPSTGRLHILPVCYESLGYFTDSTYSEFKAQLMEGYEMSEDAKTYTIKLREDIYDTAGNHLTADDVIFSWDKGIELGGNTWGRYVDEYHKVDDYTIELNLLTARADAFVTIGRSPIVTQAAYEASEDEMTMTVVSTSQYNLVEAVSGSSFTFEKNENYWNKDENTWMWKSNPDKVIYQVILEESQMAIALETGAIDIAVGMSNNSTNRYANDDNYNMFQLVGNMVYSLMFNCSENSVFHDNKELRQAVAYAIDAEGIIEAVLGGAGIKVGTMGFCLAGDYRDEWADSYYNYDVEKARELLAEAGYEQGELEISLACSSGSILEKSAELIQLYLLDAGFKTVTINAVDNALFSTIKNDRTEWDLLLDTKGSQTVAISASLYDKTVASYGNPCFIDDDDKIQAYSELLPTTLGGTQENVDEYVAYANEMCYMYGLFNTASYTVTTKDITYIIQDFRSAVIPGEIVFAE